MNDRATVGALGEEGIIALFAGSGAELAPSGAELSQAPEGAESGRDDGLVVSNGDDAAAWSWADDASVVTTDSLVEGQHFDLAYTPPDAVGRKLVAVNLSDLAAMGATPKYVLLSVCLPNATPIETVRRMAGGVREACRRFGVRIIGGNTTGIQGPIVLTATLIGAADPTSLIRRDGARPGDDIFVTGTLGDAAAGLHAALDGRSTAGPTEARLFEALADPEPRVAAGRAIAETRAVTAMCDVSDGFGRDLRRLLAYGGLGAQIDGDSLPLSEALKEYAASRGTDPSQIAMAGGEDYELLFTAPAERSAVVVAACRATDTPVVRVGRTTVSTAVEAVFADGRTMPVPTGFEHFEAGA